MACARRSRASSCRRGQPRSCRWTALRTRVRRQRLQRERTAGGGLLTRRVDPRKRCPVAETALAAPDLRRVEAHDKVREHRLRWHQVVRKELRHQVRPEVDANNVAHVTLRDDDVARIVLAGNGGPPGEVPGVLRGANHSRREARAYQRLGARKLTPQLGGPSPQAPRAYSPISARAGWSP